MWGKGALLPDHSLSLPEESGSNQSGMCVLSEQSVCPRTLLERSHATLIKVAAPESGNWMEIKEKQFTYAHIAPLTLVNKIAFG